MTQKLVSATLNYKYSGGGREYMDDEEWLIFVIAVVFGTAFAIILVSFTAGNIVRDFFNQIGLGQLGGTIGAAVAFIVFIYIGGKLISLVLNNA